MSSSKPPPYRVSLLHGQEVARGQKEVIRLGVNMNCFISFFSLDIFLSISFNFLKNRQYLGKDAFSNASVVRNKKNS